MSLNKIMIDIMNDIITKVEKQNELIYSTQTCLRKPFDISLEETEYQKQRLKQINSQFKKRKRDTDEVIQVKKLKHALSGIVPDDQHHLWENKSPFPKLMQTWYKKGKDDFINIYNDGDVSMCVCTKTIVC